jgi:hypothetical protein
MTAEDREAALAGWQKLLDRLRADSSLLLPVHGTRLWPLWFRAPEYVRDAEHLAAEAGSLGVTDFRVRHCLEEDGWSLLQLDGRIGEVWVRITAEGTLKLPEVAAALATAGAGGAR